MHSVIPIISDHIGAWLATTTVAFLTVFSDKIFERIRFRLNRADLRVKYFEELAIDLSTYLFYVEILQERHQKGWADDLEDMTAIIGEVNDAVTTLRKKEYLYRSWVYRYWGRARMSLFAEVMSAVKSVDDATHPFNDPGGEAEKAATLGKELAALRVKVEAWMAQAV